MVMDRRGGGEYAQGQERDGNGRIQRDKEKK